MPILEDVVAGLKAKNKELPSKYFYDALGSQLFEAITLLPEYYPTRAETEIFQRYSEIIAEMQPFPVVLVELGSGSSNKSGILIEKILARQGTLKYQPIDISPSILENAAEKLRGVHPNITVIPHVGDYTQGLDAIVSNESERCLVMFLGSNIGNYKLDEAFELLKSIRSRLKQGAGLLLGADLIKDIRIIEAAYNDPLGVTAAFNLNILRRINRELDADFDIRKFCHRAFFNTSKNRIEMHLVSRIDQTVLIKQANLKVDFQKDESIHTESSHKYDEKLLENMARETGFKVAKVWTDSQNLFSCNYWIAN